MGTLNKRGISATVVIIPMAVVGVLMTVAIGPARTWLGYPTTNTEIAQVINQSCAAVA